MVDFTIENGVIVSIDKTRCEYTNYDVHIVGILHNHQVVYVKYGSYAIEPSYKDEPKFRIGDVIDTNVDIDFSSSTNASAVLSGGILKCHLQTNVSG